MEMGRKVGRTMARKSRMKRRKSLPVECPIIRILTRLRESAPSFTPGEGSSRHGPTEGPSSRAPNEEYEEESFYDDDGDSIMS